jgi:hypothetical protein
MKTKQTAIESIKTTFFHYAEPYPYFSEQEKWVITKEELFEVLEQAKEIEKTQLISCYVIADCRCNKEYAINEAEKYYNETYGGNK